MLKLPPGRLPVADAPILKEPPVPLELVFCYANGLFYAEPGLRKGLTGSDAGCIAGKLGLMKLDDRSYG